MLHCDGVIWSFRGQRTSIKGRIYHLFHVDNIVTLVIIITIIIIIVVIITIVIITIVIITILPNFQQSPPPLSPSSPHGTSNSLSHPPLKSSHALSYLDHLYNGLRLCLLFFIQDENYDEDEFNKKKSPFSSSSPHRELAPPPWPRTPSPCSSSSPPPSSWKCKLKRGILIEDIKS